MPTWGKELRVEEGNPKSSRRCFCFSSPELRNREPDEAVQSEGNPLTTNNQSRKQK